MRFSPPPELPCAKILQNGLLSRSSRARQRNLREAVRIKTGYVLIIRCSERLLGLDHFNVVRDAGANTILRLTESGRSKFACGFRGLDLFGGCTQIELSILDVLVDASAQILGLRAPLRQQGAGIFHVAFDSPALEDRNSYCARRGPTRTY